MGGKNGGCYVWVRTSFVFRGREEHQDFEFFGNVVEPMFQFGLDEDNGAGAHLGVVRANLHASASSDDVRHFVFAVWFLWIGAAFGEYIDARAHGRDAKKLEVGFSFFATRLGEFVDMEVVRHEILSRTEN